MKIKAHLVFPQNILEEVDQIAGKRKRSLFIVKATQEKLQKERFLKTLDETKGAWLQFEYFVLSFHMVAWAIF